MEAFEHRGCRLAYAVAGHGPRVLWIQGTGLHGEGWRPQLVVGGEEDVIARPELVRALGAGILGARVVVLERAAHGVPVMEAERINELVREHIAAVERGG